MMLVDRLRQLQLKCYKLPKSETESEAENTYRDLNDDINNKMAALIQYHNKMENILKIAKEKNNKATIKGLSYVTKYQNAIKELDDLRQENVILEEYISEIKIHNMMIEKIKQENDYLRLIHKKNISTIFRLKEEMLNSTELFINKPPLSIDLDFNLLGFDSVTVSKSETKIDPQCETYQSVYDKIQKDSVDVQDALNSLFSVMKQTNLSIETAIKDIDIITSQTIHKVKVAKEQFARISQNDQNVINELTKTRYFLEQQKLNSACRLNILESDFKSLGNRVKIKRIPTYLTHNKCSSWYLKKLSIKKLFCIWNKMMKITGWSHNLKKIDEKNESNRLRSD